MFWGRGFRGNRKRRTVLLFGFSVSNTFQNFGKCLPKLLILRASCVTKQTSPFKKKSFFYFILNHTYKEPKILILLWFLNISNSARFLDSCCSTESESELAVVNVQRNVF